jgi:dephospho-CoA kinase
VGLIGGVGSGKSSVARRVAALRSVVIVDGDQAGHAVLRDPAVKQQLRQQFGETIFDASGEVSRLALGRMVFGDSAEQQAAKAALERIVHPRIRHALEEQVHNFQSRSDIDAVLLDAAVLLEAKWNDICDCVAFIDVPVELRLKRVLESRKWDAQEFHRREASQLPIADKRRASDVVIDNSGDLDHAADQLARAIDECPRRHP